MKFNEQQAKNEPKRAKHQPKCTFQTAYMIHGPAPPLKVFQIEPVVDAHCELSELHVVFEC